MEFKFEELVEITVVGGNRWVFNLMKLFVDQSCGNNRRFHGIVKLKACQ